MMSDALPKSRSPTRIAVELSYIDEGLANLPGGRPEDVSSFSLFIACLPYRFYVIQALMFIPLIALLGRDFGPMSGGDGSDVKGYRVEITSDFYEVMTITARYNYYSK